MTSLKDSNADQLLMCSNQQRLDSACNTSAYTGRLGDVCNLEDNDDDHPQQQQHDEAHDSPAHHAHLDQSQRSIEDTAQHV